MTNTAKLAVLIPTSNGGELLRESIESCSGSGLSPSDYSILVVDNGSTDGSADGLPAKDAIGATITVHRNEDNLGRVGNWNRAVELALEAGFQWAVFLFVGDLWMAGNGLPVLLARMESLQATMAMAPIQIVAADGSPLRSGNRISIPSEEYITSSDVLLRKSVGMGHVPFAPIQANIYRLYRDNPLVFDPDEPMSTDIAATIEHLQSHPGPVIVSSQAFLAWRLHSKRFYSSQDAVSFMEVNNALLERVSKRTGIAVNWSNANAILFLNSLWGRLFIPMPFKSRMDLFLRSMRYIRSRPGGISFSYLFSAVANKVIWNRSYISLP